MRQGVLMYSSDHPHAEFRFPESTSKVLAWGSLGNEVMRKNAVEEPDKMLRRTVEASRQYTERSALTAAIGGLYPGS